MSECVYHEIAPLTRGRKNVFRVQVFRGGELEAVDPDTGEATFVGGRLVATLFRSTLNEAHRAGIDYSFVTGAGRKPRR